MAEAIAVRTEQRITHSEMQTAKTCLRKEFLAYQRGIRPEREAQPLRMGGAVHKALDAYKQYLRKKMEWDDKPDTDGIIRATLFEYDMHKPTDIAYLYDWEIERETISRLLAGYFWRWAEMDDGMEIIASELQFELPIINPDSGRAGRTATVAGCIDGTVKLPGGQLAVMEHKTSGGDIGPESDYWKKLRIDSQISLYYLAAQMLGYDVQTVLYDVIGKPSIRPYKATPLEKRKYKKTTGELYANQHEDNETPTEYGERIREDMTEQPNNYYARREIPRMESDLEEFKYELWQMSKLLHDCKKFGRWPRNTGACIGFGRCPYFELCTGGYDINSGELPAGYVIVENVHQELDNGN